MVWSGLLSGAVGASARTVAEAKFTLTPEQAFVCGIVCNALVCLAVWLSLGARSAAGKVLVIVLPIAALVALGFEYSVANMFRLPVGIGAGADGGFAELVANLVPVTLGNIVGGVATAYHLAYAPDRD